MRTTAMALLVMLATLASAAENARPNIIVIIADDVGYGDLSCYGATAMTTPNLDRLAAEGCRFTNGHSSASTCTPTRYSIMIGQYAFRKKGTGIAPPNAPALIAPGTETLPAMLQRAGYKTAAIGKWHLGLGIGAPDWNGELKPGPLEIGFDHCLILPTTNDRVPQVFVEDHHVRGLDPADPLWVGDAAPAPNFPDGIAQRATLRMNWTHGHNQSVHNGIGRIGFYTGGNAARFRDEDLADTWVAESKRWITQHRERPFFLYFAAHNIHVPRMPHERFQGTTGLGYRGDALAELDWCVGELTRTLDELNIAENTLVIFCSDNGPVLDDGYADGAVEKLGAHRPAGPLSGGKGGVLEGGTRIPFITRWKGHIAPGTSQALVATIDFAASFARLTGQPLPENTFPDSFDVKDALLGAPGAAGRPHLLQQDNGGTNYGLRAGDWKLIRQKHWGTSQAVITLTPHTTPKGEFALYNLAVDPGEQHDLAQTHPEKLTEMKTLLDQILTTPRTRPSS